MMPRKDSTGIDSHLTRERKNPTGRANSMARTSALAVNIKCSINRVKI